MATAASRITREEDRANPAVVKVVLGERGQALYFSRSVIPHVRDGGADGGDVTHWRHLGIYAYRRVFLERLVGAPPCMLERAEKLEQLRALYLGARMLVVETEARGKGIDTPADVPYVEALIRGR
jgi:3-deoxy-manno-octulosonate cytidylyltransferase (CMP-KDO synthetase)